MKHQSKLDVIVGTMAPGGLPAVALGAAGDRANDSTTHTIGAERPPRATAYGKFGQNQGTTHTAGKRGTPVSACVQGADKLLREQLGE